MKPVVALMLAAFLLVSQEGVWAENRILKWGEIEQEGRGQKSIRIANDGSRFKRQANSGSRFKRQANSGSRFKRQANSGSRFKNRSDDVSKEGVEEDAQGSEGEKGAGAGGEQKAGKKKGNSSQEDLECGREREGKTKGKKDKLKTKKGRKGNGCGVPRDDKLKQDSAKTMDAEATAKKLREQHEKRTADGLGNAIEKRNNAMESLDAIAPEFELKEVDEGAVDLGKGDQIGDL